MQWCEQMGLHADAAKTGIICPGRGGGAACANWEAQQEEEHVGAQEEGQVEPHKLVSLPRK